MVEEVSENPTHLDSDRFFSIRERAGCRGMKMGNFSAGASYYFHLVRQRSSVLAGGIGGRCLDIFLSPIISLSVGDKGIM